METERPAYRKDYIYEKAFKTFYKLHNTAATWPDAKIRCEAEGSELMIPESLDEADAMPVLITAVLSKYNGVYVGIHDLYSERTYVTLKGKLMQDTILNLLWERNEPRPNGGRCLAMQRSGRFFVNPCTQPLPFICKTKAEKITYNKECKSFDKRWKLGSKNICFYMHTEPQTWYQAYMTCLASGGHLLIVNDRNEAKYVRDLFKETPERRVPDNEFAFLGFSDLFQRHNFKTIHDQKIEDVGYSDWDVKCSQNEKSVPQRCGGVRRNGLLTTGDCNVPAMFFCEKLLNATVSKQALRQRVKKAKPALQSQAQMNSADGLFEDIL
ncbi:C-type lectin 17 [Bombyx mori]|uniref:Low-expression lectin 1 n=1 Tax=Bombyx mori TaxID=7091 RepID=B3IYT1_BOMMO|nr:C-type lectin 17 [Bombyx mori]BAG54784.1 low-expression lectin 1 [Bombyx mori]